MSLRELAMKAAAEGPPITSFDIEQVMRELWEEVAEEPARFVMSRDTWLILRTAYRSGVKRRRRQRMIRPRYGLLPRSVQIREREGKFERFERRYGRRW